MRLRHGVCTTRGMGKNNIRAVGFEEVNNCAEILLGTRFGDRRIKCHMKCISFSLGRFVRPLSANDCNMLFWNTFFYRHHSRQVCEKVQVWKVSQLDSNMSLSADVVRWTYVQTNLWVQDHQRLINTKDTFASGPSFSSIGPSVPSASAFCCLATMVPCPFSINDAGCQPRERAVSVCWIMLCWACLNSSTGMFELCSSTTGMY